MSQLPEITRPAGTFEWVKEHRRLYLRSGGAQGHIMDLTGAAFRGADHHFAAGTVDFQIATQAFRATWREPEGAERDKVWAFMVDSFPFYGVYQTRTERVIPLIMMKAIAPVAVFSEADLA